MPQRPTLRLAESQSPLEGMATLASQPEQHDRLQADSGEHADQERGGVGLLLPDEQSRHDRQRGEQGGPLRGRKRTASVEDSREGGTESHQHHQQSRNGKELPGGFHQFRGCVGKEPWPGPVEWSDQEGHDQNRQRGQFAEKPVGESLPFLPALIGITSELSQKGTSRRMDQQGHGERREQHEQRVSIRGNTRAEQEGDQQFLAERHEAAGGAGKGDEQSGTCDVRQPIITTHHAPKRGGRRPPVPRYRGEFLAATGTNCLVPTVFVPVSGRRAIGARKAGG